MRTHEAFSLSLVLGSIRNGLVRLLPSGPARLGAFLLISTVIVGVMWSSYSSTQAPAFEVEADASSSLSGDAVGEEEKSARQVVVYVSGAVRSPGVYELGEGSRVNDAIAAAGGLAEDAQPSQINLARVVSDGEQIAIPSQAEVDAASQGAAQSGQTAGGAASSGLVNINLADAAALQTLSGVGPSTAQAIIADREQNGSVSSIDDLMRVDGIGEKKFAKIKDAICI